MNRQAKIEKLEFKDENEFRLYNGFIGFHFLQKNSAQITDMAVHTGKILLQA